MSDIEFMSIKQFQGKILKADGSVATAAEIASIVPATGKTFYIAGASVAFDDTSITSANSAARVALRNDTVTLEVKIFEGKIVSSGSGIGGRAYVTEVFALKGDSLIGNGAKKYSLNVEAVTNCTSYGMLYGFIEDDAIDPRV